MRFDVLGPLRVTGPAGRVELPGGHLPALLAWLVLNANRPLPVAPVVAVLWPTKPPPSAAARVRAGARQLAALLDGALTVTERLTLTCADDAIDAERFTGELDAAQRHLAHHRPEHARDKLRAALALWRGGPYPELDRALPALAVIDGLIERRLQALEALYGIALTETVDYQLVADLRAAITLHPERARLRRQLALALYRTGRQVDALAALRQAAAERDRPDPDADALQAAILRQDPALQAGEPGERATVVRRLPHRV